MKTETDHIADLAPLPAEPRPVWLARVGLWLIAWFRKPRSRLGLVLAACVLVQGCATSAWHNYQVLEAERSEQAQLDAGRIPLVKTNGDLIRENWAGYVAGLILDAGSMLLLHKAYRDWRDDEGNIVVSPNVENNYYPVPIADDGATGAE